MNLDHLSGPGGAPGGVSFPGGAGGDNHADPDATPMPIKEEAGGLRFMEGSKIQRPLSSLAALQPSSTNGLNWNSYLGLGTPSANSNANGFLGGWTPGGGTGGNTTLAGLDMAGLGAFGTGLTPAKDMDSKEMKEFWKQYLRTPLTTSENPMDAATAAAAAGAGGDPNGATTPFRRPRVTSMPSSNKTPLAVDRDRLSYYQQPRQAGGLGPTSSLRTTLQQPSAGGKMSKEDLASYEAAVLARKTPINLNMGRLSSRRRGGSVNPPPPGQSGSGLSQASSSGENLTMQGIQHAQHQHQQMLAHHHQLVQQARATNGSDGDTSASASPASRASSLAADSYPSPHPHPHAYGGAASQHDVDMDAGSRPGSSAGLGLSMGGGAGGTKLQRPTAKRLASSVLESGTNKAMKFDENPQSPSLQTLSNVPPASGLTLPQLHHAVAQQQQAQPLGSVTSLPPISTNFDAGYSGNQKQGGGMMAPPPQPSSAPPVGGSVLNMNLPRGSLAERRRMAAAAMADARN